MLAPKVSPAATRWPMSSPTASLVRSTVDSETCRAASFLSTTLAASPKLLTAPARQTSSFVPGVIACRDSPRVSSQGTEPTPQDRQW